MKFSESLKDLTLESLLALFARSTEQLLEAKINKEEEKMIRMYQKILELVQQAIVTKRAELPPLK